MKTKLIAIILCAGLLLAACGEKKAERSGDPVDNRVNSEQSIGANGESNVNRETVADEAEAEAARSVLAAMLNGFAGLDYEGALLYIRESDRELFDFSNTSSQKPLYDNLLSHMSYELGEVYTSGGRVYVSAEITSPDMLDVYGDLNLLYIDALMNGEITSEEESREFNNRALPEIVAQEDLKYKTMPVDVEIMKDGDGEKRVVFTAELMNAMLGDIQTAGSQVSQAIEEGTQEYTAAKDAGAFDE
ncbi:MAG: hypothetical protein J1F63_04275 [Oscillospiraceae bacterium]|nr:hypothetical protein [Oscillospiraceae bacterium]